MTRFAIDAGSLLQLVRGGHHPHPAHQLVAPNSIRLRALELLLQEVREGRLSDGAALDLHERMTGVRMRVLGDRMSRRTAWRLSRENNWNNLEDAGYIAVATLQADALITSDATLADRAAGIVPVAPIAHLLRAEMP